METNEIRLECLRLAISKSPEHGEALKRAKEYVDFVENTQDDTKQPKAPETAPKVDKKSGNLSSLMK